MVKEVNKLSTAPLSLWPTYSAVLAKIEKENDEMVYQCQTLKNFHQAKNLFVSYYKEYCSSITACLRSRLQWSDLDLIRDVIITLENQGWNKLMDDIESYLTAVGEENPHPAAPIDRLGERFEQPLVSAVVDITELVSLSTLRYKEVWW